VGNYSIYCLLAFSRTCVPNIMKIRQCFLKLQLKMSGMFFFETHCIYTGLATVVFSLCMGHCECLASLVGPVRVLSAVMLLWNCFMNK